MCAEARKNTFKWVNHVITTYKNVYFIVTPWALRRKKKKCASSISWGLQVMSSHFGALSIEIWRRSTIFAADRKRRRKIHIDFQHQYIHTRTPSSCHHDSDRFAIVQTTYDTISTVHVHIIIIILFFLLFWLLYSDGIVRIYGTIRFALLCFAMLWYAFIQ